MSTVTIFCRDGACNRPGHTAANCYNRYAATRATMLTSRDWETVKASRIASSAPHAELAPGTLHGPCVRCGELAYRTHLEGTTSHSDTGEPAC